MWVGAAMPGWHGVRLKTGLHDQQSVVRLEFSNDKAYSQSTCQKQSVIFLT